MNISYNIKKLKEYHFQIVRHFLKMDPTKWNLEVKFGMLEQWLFNKASANITTMETSSFITYHH